VKKRGGRKKKKKRRGGIDVKKEKITQRPSSTSILPCRGEGGRKEKREGKGGRGAKPFSIISSTSEKKRGEGRDVATGEKGLLFVTARRKKKGEIIGTTRVYVI